MKLVSKAIRYWRTLRYLKLVQIYSRLWFYIYTPKLTCRTSLQRRITAPEWQVPVAKPDSMLDSASFSFLNRKHNLPERGGWNDAALEKLWLYNLHYFDDLNSTNAPLRYEWHSDFLQRWVEENPPTLGVGWEPYPTSVRIVNWVKWVLAGNFLTDISRESLTLQARWLNGRLEFHLLGNHLFSNAKALVFAGLFFNGQEADDWLNNGLRVIAKQLPEQVLTDGAHFERSTMYHAIFLEDVLDLINVATICPDGINPEIVVEWRSVAARMLDWLLGITHPDGQIGFFNDAALGIAPRSHALVDYAIRLGVAFPYRDCHIELSEGALKLSHWPDSGYIRLESRRAVALLDVAPIGPDYLPGHAHADTLSFEVSVFGQRVFVNGGTSTYELGVDRIRERQTRSHSTVEVAGECSSEVWGSFRVARRAYPFALATALEVGRVSVCCSHDGYTRLPGRPVHSREWVMSENCLTISDSVTERRHCAIARYVLHPSVQVLRSSKDLFELRLAGGQTIKCEVLFGKAHVESARYAPEFGKILPTQCLKIELSDGSAALKLIWI